MRPNLIKTEYARRKQIVLAPASDLSGTSHENLRCERNLYNRLLREVQRLRGRVYLEDGAIRREHLTRDGRHESPTDAVSWHLVTLNDLGSVVACARFQVHRPTARFEQLGVARSAMAQCPVWGRRLRQSVEAELRRARATGHRFVEAGGWALDESVRHTMEAFRIALGAFAWSGLTGKAIGITTATFRNHSAEILRKMGGRPMRENGVELPRYFDPQYDCDMQILTFETGGHAPRFHEAVQKQTRDLASSTFICSTPPVPVFLPAFAAHAHATAAA